jgi:hypothetical protein
MKASRIAFAKKESFDEFSFIIYYWNLSSEVAVRFQSSIKKKKDVSFFETYINSLCVGAQYLSL